MAKSTSEKAYRKKFIGEVVGNANEKTVLVRVENLKKHRLYNKLMKRSKNYQAHTEKEIEIGTTVEITEGKKMSKNKNYVVTKIVEG